MASGGIRVLNQIGDTTQHIVFRLVSIAFSAVSAWGIYWFFSALGDDVPQRVVTVVTSLSFVLLNYFVVRGMSYRIRHKRHVGWYIVIAALCLFVEMTCNFAHAAAEYPDVAWLVGMDPGWQKSLFLILTPVVLSIIPIFTFFIAHIDVDLALERTASFAPKQANNPAPYSSGYAPKPQPGQPAMPPPGGNMAGHYQNKRSAAQIAAQMAGSNGKQPVVP